ncbi:tRNA-specific 2-thiouridylase [Opitutaceae bacterium TAV4]|nr:tRNA-specific 2-thiouridylase [Opitutaceae bacterium TAV4]
MLNVRGEAPPPPPPPAREKILVAMSGGVDSSVAALLLKRAGADIEGAYMKNWINEDNIIGDCPWQQDIEDARRVADQLGIPFRVVNLMDEYRDRVVAYLLDGYRRGLTPNPDIMCNREIKFGVFRAWARDHGFTAVATGHYARRVPLSAADTAPAACASTVGASLAKPASANDAQSAIVAPSGCAGFASEARAPSAWALHEGADPNKDQSYFLALLTQAQLADARFPIGDIEKPELRRLAREAGLATADKKDSQGICFIGQVKMQDFLRQYVPDNPGPIVRATDQRIIGEHRGLHYFTLGQRKGIGVPSNTDNKAYVVTGKRSDDNALLVAFDGADAPGLFQTEVRVHSLQWNTPDGAPPAFLTSGGPGPHALEGRVRYRDPRIPLTITLTPDLAPATAHIRFETPQRGLASGQILALYAGPRLLGGAVYT